MAICKEKGACVHAYRKAGSNAVHCGIQAEQGGKWDFCKYQYICRRTGRYEMSKETSSCNLPAAKAKKTAPKKAAKSAKKPKKAAEKSE